MQRYIEESKAYEVLSDYYHHRTQCQHEALREAFNRVPTADVVPVVRCRDCVKFDARYGICNEDTWSSGSDGYAPCVLPDDFCSYGERREECGE